VVITLWDFTCQREITCEVLFRLLIETRRQLDTGTVVFIIYVSKLFLSA